jgi:chemotaxis protein histidine kinase CheA
MLMYQDPTMKEIVDDFCKESKKQIPQLNECLYALEDDITNRKEFEAFGQIIDRMMGAAKSLEIHSMGTFCELGKSIGYKASQVEDENLLSIVVAVLFDTVEILETLVNKLEKVENLELKEISTDAFVSRLKWVK